MNHREVWKPKEKDSKNEGWTFPWIRFIEPVKERQAWRHANIYTRPPQLSGLLWNVPPPPNKKKKEGKHFFLLVHLNLRNTLRKYPALEPFYNAFDHRNFPQTYWHGVQEENRADLSYMQFKFRFPTRGGWPQFAPVSLTGICLWECLVCKLRVTSKACFSSSKSCFPGAYIWCEELPTATITRPPWTWGLYEVRRCHTSSLQQKGSTWTSHKSVCDSL